MSVSEIIAQTEHKMKATVEHTREEFVKIRTGRASTGLLDQIKVDYYGCPTRSTRWRRSVWATPAR